MSGRAHVCGPYRALGWRFGVRSTNRELGRYLQWVLSPLACDGDVAGWYTVDDLDTPGGPVGVLERDGTTIEVAPDPAILAELLMWDVNQQAQARTRDRLLVHAAVADHGGRGILLPAPMESGKTTLVAALVLDGLRYVTDEIAAYDPATGLVEAYPKPLSVDRGSWPVLPALAAGRPAEWSGFVRNQWLVPVESVRPDAVAATTRVHAVVFPRYVAGERSRLTRVTTGQAAIRLSEQVFRWREDPPRMLAWAAELLRGVACHQLVVGADLDRACRLVRAAAGAERPVVSARR